MSTNSLVTVDRLGRRWHRTDPYDLVMKRTMVEGDCLVFTGYRSAKGYGRVNVGGKKIAQTHRVVWEHHHGPIPDGKCVLHSCDNPPCVEITHLRVGTPADNSADMVARGRSGHTHGERSGQSKWSDAEIDQLRARVESGTPVAVAAEEIGMRPKYATNVLAGRRRGHQAPPDAKDRVKRDREAVRREIAILRAEGLNLTAIAARTGRNSGTVWRMIERFKKDHPADAKIVGLLRPEEQP